MLVSLFLSNQIYRWKTTRTLRSDWTRVWSVYSVYLLGWFVLRDSRMWAVSFIEKFGNDVNVLSSLLFCNSGLKVDENGHYTLLKWFTSLVFWFKGCKGRSLVFIEWPTFVWFSFCVLIISPFIFILSVSCFNKSVFRIHLRIQIWRVIHGKRLLFHIDRDHSFSNP